MIEAALRVLLVEDDEDDYLLKGRLDAATLGRSIRYTASPTTSRRDCG